MYRILLIYINAMCRLTKFWLNPLGKQTKTLSCRQIYKHKNIEKAKGRDIR